MTYIAKNPIQHGLADGTAVTLQPGDELTEEHNFTDSDIDQLLEVGAIEEASETPDDQAAEESSNTGEQKVELPEDLDKHEEE